MKRKLLLFSLLLVLALALLSGTFAHPFGVNAARPTSTPAYQVHVTGTRHSASKLRPSFAGSNLIYNGGPVMGGTTRVHAIFWEPRGSFVSATYNSLLQRYFGDVGSSNLYHNNVQYPDARRNVPTNAVLTNYWIDTAAYPSNPLRDGQIQKEVIRAMSVNHWTASINDIFFVFIAKGENICLDSSTCSFTAFCGYHSHFGNNTLYTSLPYMGTNLSACGTNSSPNHDFDADSTISITSHEQMEAATDPLLSAWYDAGGNEVGDKCAWNFGGTNYAGANVVWNGHGYVVQREWDNARHTCVLVGP